MVGIYLVTTVVARKEVTTHSRRTAIEYILESATMTGQHFLAVPIQILIAITTKNIRNFQHATWLSRKEVRGRP
jgi:hypothetical protein